MLNKRRIAGLLLMVIAISGLVYWELYGREIVLTEPVLVAKSDIPAGREVNPDDFIVIGIPLENKIPGAISAVDSKLFTGKVAGQSIHRNQQILSEYFLENDFSLEGGKSIFVIPPEWITMRSSSIRRGDLVEIYEDRQKSRLGVYRVAFVKDREEIEVIDPAGPVENPLDRVSGSKVVSHIEIIAGTDDYLRILEEVTGATGAGLILVQGRSDGS